MMRKSILLKFIFLIIGNFAYSQPSSEINFNPKHTYVKSQIKTSEHQSLLIINKTDSTYFFKYQTFGGCVREYMTSKGKIKIKKDTLILKTILPDENYSDYEFKSENDREFSYIKPFENELSNHNEIKLYITKEYLNIFPGTIQDLKIFRDNEDKTEQVSDFQTLEFKDYYYFVFNKEKYHQSQIFLILHDTNYLIDFKRIGYDNFIFIPSHYPDAGYLNMTNYHYKMNGRNFRKIPNQNYDQWFRAPE